MIGRMAGDKSNVLAGFLNTERIHFMAMPVYKAPNPIRICFAVIPQAPTDCLVDEELRLPKIIDKNLLKQFSVCFIFSDKLMVYRDAAQPEIIILAPLQESAIYFRVTESNIANNNVKPVNRVPPRF
jgi:hypothetical protein